MLQSENHSIRRFWCDVRADLRGCGAISWKHIIFSIFCNTAFHLLLIYRFSRLLAGLKIGFFNATLRWLQYLLAASEISPRSILQGGVRLPHPTGIIIGAGAVVEEGAYIFQQVTLGSHGRRGGDNAYPIICRGARIYAGAKVIGGIRIGVGAIVGANSVVLIDVPDGATAVGIPARVIKA